MGRKIKPLIYVFCEGESEIEYTKFLKNLSAVTFRGHFFVKI